MACEFRRTDHGAVIVCGTRRKAPPCKMCGKPSTKLCDFPLRGPKAGQTCSIPICDGCATPQGEGIDYCPVHQRLIEKQRCAGVHQ